MAKKEEVKKQEMSLADARKYRASLYKPEAVELSLEEKREAFRIFWAQAKSKYKKSKDIEQVLWLHLKAIKMDAPEKFEAGLEHFGLKKIGQ